MSDRRVIFLWGALGAILPEVIRFFRIASIAQPIPPLNWTFYVAMLAVYCAVAGFTAIAWKPDAEWKALWWVHLSLL